MPKVVINEQHFTFLRELVARFIDSHADVAHNIFGDAPTELDVEFASEVLTLLGYTRHFKKFSVEIVPDEDDEEG